MVSGNVDWMFDDNFYIKNGKWQYSKNADKNLIKQFVLFFKQLKNNSKIIKSVYKFVNMVYNIIIN